MDRVGRLLLAAAVAGAALAVGTVHAATLCVVALGLSVAVVCIWHRSEAQAMRPAASLLLAVGVGLTLLTALQCVPIPLRWLAALAPKNADVWARALQPLHGAMLSWGSLSVDPIATRIEVLKGLSYVLAFVAAVRVARDQRGVTFLGSVIVWTGLVLAIAALLHPAFGMRKLFGLYEPPVMLNGRHLAPLMNANNLAGYLNLSFCLALAWTVSPRRGIPRSIMASVAVVLVATQLWIASRGGVITMAVGCLVVVGTLRLAGRRQQTRTPASWLAVGAAIAAGTVMVVIGGSSEALGELFESDVSKLQQLGTFAHMLPAYGWLGCGRGAFESAFPAFRTDVTYMTWSHPENVVAQWTIEWGLPVGLCALSAVAFALRPRNVLARSATSIGAWGGLIALAVQNLADLGTEIPGLMLSAVICAAMVVGGSAGREPRFRLERWSLHPRAVGLATGVAGIAAVAWVVPAVGSELHAQERELFRAAIQAPTEAARMHTLAQAAMSVHPAEPYFPYIVAVRAVNRGDDDAMPWAAGALERANVYGPAHLVLAHVLMRRSPAQARMEYRFAATQAPEIATYAARDAEPIVASYRDAMEVVPSGLDTAVLTTFVNDLGARLPATRVALDAELAARAPTEPGPEIRAARDATADLEEGDAAPWCTGTDRPSCTRAALEKSERVERLMPDKCEGFVLHARARAADGDFVHALSELEDASERALDRVECLKEMAILAHRASDSQRMELALTRIAAAGCAVDSECVENLSWVGVFEEQQGNIRRALAMYKRAYERAPSDDGLLERIAALASRASLHVEAAEDYEVLVRHQPGDPRWRNSLQIEREAAAKEAARL